jgi:hypothetical protein
VALALERLEAARVHCATLDAEQRTWPGRREIAAEEFRKALAAYYAVQEVTN